MKFHRVVGKIDANLVADAEKALSRVFLDLGLNPKNNHMNGSLGGDPLIFSLVYPMQHVATMNIPTAGTDGRRYYWNPKFVCSKSRLGLRFIVAHEAGHAIYMHPQRRGSRMPKLWNIAVDYIVNGTFIMDDLKHRKMEPSATFKKELGNFVTLEAYANHIRDPFKKIEGSEDWVPESEDPEDKNIKLPKVDDDRELTEEEKAFLKKKEEKVMYFFADPNLPKDFRKPERIYDYLYNLLPKCPKCGRVGIYKLPESKSKEKNESEKDPNEQDKNDDHKDSGNSERCNDDGPCDHNHSSDDHEDDQKDGGCSNSGCVPNSKPGCCDGCEGGYDIFDVGDTLDEHMDSEESQGKMAKRIADAMESAKKMAGSVPGNLEDELNKLMAPKVRWQDLIRAKISRSRDGNTKNDWTRFRSRPLFGGLMIPKKINQICTFGCLLDTSGSMSKEDMTFGVSQLQSIDERSEGYLVCGDSDIYWDKATKLRSASATELSKVKIVGRGGTMFAQFFKDYKKKLGNVDFLIVITDGYLMDTDIADMVNPGVDVMWLITSESSFTAPFGKVLSLKD